MMGLTYLPAALADLREIALYIAEDNPDRAVSFVNALRIKAAEIIERPASFAARDDLAPGFARIAGGTLWSLPHPLPSRGRWCRDCAGTARCPRSAQGLKYMNSTCGIERQFSRRPRLQ